MNIIGTRWKAKRTSPFGELIYIGSRGKNGGGRDRSGQPTSRTVYWYSDVPFDGSTRPITRYNLLRYFTKV